MIRSSVWTVSPPMSIVVKPAVRAEAEMKNELSASPPSASPPWVNEAAVSNDPMATAPSATRASEETMAIFESSVHCTHGRRVSSTVTIGTPRPPMMNSAEIAPNKLCVLLERRRCPACRLRGRSRRC